MDSVAAVQCADAAEPASAGRGTLPLSALHPGDCAIVVSVGSTDRTLSPLERRLLELGFVSGEWVEVIAEARPGRDPFVVRLGATALALRRREVESVWVSPRPSERR
jgi:Fe2+ transport system protein FeoA